MDLVGSCKDKLAYFRIKELKDILTQLGLSKQGKKQDLVDRILGVLSDEQVSKAWAKKNSIRKEEVAKLVDDTYRKMQVSGATDLASKAQGASDCSNSKINGEIDDSKVRCPCGSSALETESVIKCEDPRCRVWQHIACVIIPEKNTEGNPQLPDVFYCEICRLSRADPFWVTIAHPLYPVKLATTSVPTDGSSPMQGVEKTFHLTRADKDLLTKQEYDVQAWCMLLNDKVPFRMQWPQFADLQVNGVPVRAINRPGSQLLGTNGRDDGPIITPCTKDGINKISLTGCDARIFCLGVRIVKRRTVQQILNLIPKESNGESFEEALARVCRCVGGTPTDNADSDSDIELVAESITVNLRCPMSGSRMKVAGRFKPCGHMGGFDLDVFVELNQRSRKWQCPICLNNHSLESVIIDPYFNRITTKMRHCGEDVTEVEVKPDGSWRVKAKTEAERRDVGELAQWHYPDGNLCAPNSEHVSKMEAVKQVKQEGSSEGHTGTGLKIGIRKNRNGFWEVSKPEGASSGRLPENFENHEQKVIPMSSSASGSGRDGEDRSVNQGGGGGNFDFSNAGMELESIPLNAFPNYGLADQNFSAPAGDADVIVLSDSDDDTDVLIPRETLYKNNQTDDGGPAYSAPAPIIADPYPQDHTLGASGTSCLGLFNPNEEDYSIDIWSMGNQAVPGGFQLFSSDVSDSLVDMQQGPTNSNCPLPMNGYAFPSDTVMGPNGLLPDSFVDRSDTDINNGLVDNPLAFGGEDPALQIFLPTRPSDATVRSGLRIRDDVSNGVRTDDWISLRLGGGITATHGDSAAATNVLNSRHQMLPREGALDSFAGNDPLHLGSNGKGSRQRSDRPFSFPRQKRSVKPKLHLSIDSDTSE